MPDPRLLAPCGSTEVGVVLSDATMCTPPEISSLQDPLLLPYSNLVCCLSGHKRNEKKYTTGSFCFCILRQLTGWQHVTFLYNEIINIERLFYNYISSPVKGQNSVLNEILVKCNVRGAVLIATEKGMGSLYRSVFLNVGEVL